MQTMKFMQCSSLNWKELLFVEQNEMEYAKRRKLIDDTRQEEDYEPAMVDYNITDFDYKYGETTEEFYRKHWLNESKEDVNGRPYE